MNVRFVLVFVIILQFLDIAFTYKILSMYRKLHPEDENWADLEFNKNARRTLKRYGLGKRSFIIQVISTAILMTTFFGGIYILDFDLEFFVYACFGGLTYVNISHYGHYEVYKKLLKEKEIW